MDLGRGPDALGLYLTGGSTNADPDLSLGGVTSSVECRGLGGIVGDNSVQGLLIEYISPACGVGAATLVASGGNVTFTPPDGLAGDAVAVAAGTRAVILGADTDKFVRVQRVTGLDFAGTTSITIVKAMNGVVAMTNVTNAERVAGSTQYRCIMLYAHGTHPAREIKLWVTTTGQATYRLGTETPDSSDGTVQEIPTAFTAPSGVVFDEYTSDSDVLEIAELASTEQLALWIAKEFPASSTFTAEEAATLHVQFQGTSWLLLTTGFRLLLTNGDALRLEI